MTDSTPPTRLRIGEWTLHAGSHELERAGQRTRIPRRHARLLQRLAESAGEVVDRETLIADVWRRSHVDPHAVARNVAALRRVLGDDAAHPRYIETIPKGGYRLVAPVESEAGPSSDQPSPGSWSPRVIAAAAIGLAALGFAAWLLYARSPREIGLVAEQPLTSDPGWEVAPALSADGTLVAFVAQVPGSAVTDLVVLSTDGSARRVLEEEPGFKARPRFSPDGSRIAFLRVSSGRCEVRVRPVLTGPSRLVTDCAPGVESGIDWSSDGRYLAYTAPAGAGRAPGLSLVDVDADRLVVLPLTSPARPDGADVNPRFAPDGGRVSFERGAGTRQHLRSVDVAPPHREAMLLPGENRLIGHSWAPDGRRLVIGTDQPGFRALVQLDAISGRTRLLGGRSGQFPDIARNGDLVYELAVYDANVWTADVGTGEVAPRAAIRSNRYDGAASWAPDASRFAFVSNREDRETIWTARPDGSDERRAALDRARRWVMPAWSPAGDALLVTDVTGDADSGVWRHDLASGRSTRLAVLGADATSASHTADGRWIVFARTAPGAGRSLWRVDSALAAAPERLADAAAQHRVGDGVVVYIVPGERVLRWIDLATGTAREVDASARAAAAGAWTVAGRNLWFSAPDGETAALFRQALDGGTAERVATGIAPDAEAPNLAVAPDQRSVAFVRIDEFRADLVLARGAAR